MATEIIPGLSADAALYCLSLLPFSLRWRLSQVCRTWREIVNSPTLLEIRLREKISEELLCVFFLDPGKNSAPHEAFNRSRDGSYLRQPSIFSGPAISRRQEAETSQILLEHGSVNSGIIQEHERVQFGKENIISLPTSSSRSAEKTSETISLRIKALPIHRVNEGSNMKPSDWFWLPLLILDHPGPCDLWDLQIVSLKSCIFVLGGTTRISGTSLIQDLREDVWVFDGVKVAWEKCAVLKDRGKKLVAACDEKSGKIFVASSDEPQVQGCAPKMRIFDVHTRTWDPEAVADMPESSSRRYLHGACSKQGQFYLFLIDPDSGRQWAEFYDPVSKTWGLVHDMPTKKAVVSVDDRFFCICSENTDYQNRLSIEEFSFAGESWNGVRQFSVEGRSSQGTIPDYYLVGNQDRLCVIQSRQEQTAGRISRELQFKTSLSFVSLKENSEQEADGGTREPFGEGRNAEGPQSVDDEGAKSSNLLSLPLGSSRSTSSGVVHVRVRGEGQACLGGTLLTV